MIGLQEMPDQPVGNLMGQPHMGQEADRDLGRCQLYPVKIGWTFSTESLDAGCLYLQMKQQAVGAGSKTKGLQRRDI